jgi:hypothetical protein
MGRLGVGQHRIVSCQIVMKMLKFNNITINMAPFLIPKLSVSNLISDERKPAFLSLFDLLCAVHHFTICI